MAARGADVKLDKTDKKVFIEFKLAMNFGWETVDPMMGVFGAVDEARSNAAGWGDSERQTRQRGKVAFPYTDIGEASALVRVLFERGGGSAGREQLADWMDQVVDGGTFRSRVTAARMFGFIDSSRNRISMTDCGHDCVDPDKKSAALVDAFLSVELFRKLHERFNGDVLPPAAALERYAQGIGVTPKQTGRARQTFQKSASIAGFIDPMTGRFVKPATPDRSSMSGSAPDRRADGDGQTLAGGGRNLHPFIQGLLRELPETGVKWDHHARAKWLTLAANAFDITYSSDTKAEISINVISGDEL